MEWLHLYIALTAFAVCALVVSVLLASSGKLNIDFNSGVFTYVKFAYASFIKPHESGGEGQQHALESFYGTQVSNIKNNGWKFH